MLQVAQKPWAITACTSELAPAKLAKHLLAVCCVSWSQAALRMVHGVTWVISVLCQLAVMEKPALCVATCLKVSLCEEFIQLLLFHQSLGNTDLPEDDVTLSDATEPFPPQWRCYAKLVNTQHVFLSFLPATFSGEPACCAVRGGAVLSASSGRQQKQNQLW